MTIREACWLVRMLKKCLFCFGQIFVEILFQIQAVRVIRFAWSSEIWAEVVVAFSSRGLKDHIWFIMSLFLYLGYENKSIGLGFWVTPINIILFLTNNVDIEQIRITFMVANHLLLWYLSGYHNLVYLNCYKPKFYPQSRI